MEPVNTNIVICITGLPGTGKTTAACMFQEYLTDSSYTVKWYNTDNLRENIYPERLSDADFKERDFTEDELRRSYNGLFFLIENILKTSKRNIIITDGTYRKASQRMYLQALAEMNEANFYLVYIKADPKTAYERIKMCKTVEGLGGWVDPKDYEAVFGKEVIIIDNNRDLETLKAEVKACIPHITLAPVAIQA